MLRSISTTENTEAQRRIFSYLLGASVFSVVKVSTQKFLASSLLLIFLLCILSPLLAKSNPEEISISIPSSQMMEVAQKIWKNECGGRIDGLVAWNNGEDFASLGIGHFIWYPQNQEGPFKEVFPSFLLFLSDKGVAIPQWLRREKSCPWTSQGEFMQQRNSSQMKELGNLLKDTISLQAEFMVQRLKKSLPRIMNSWSGDRRQEMRTKFARLLEDQRGIYALLDYLNFKGEGLSHTERYQGQGWGLVQVLEEMKVPRGSDRPVRNFADAARIMLERRVANSPPERNEQRWLKGWLNRIATYTQ